MVKLFLVEMLSPLVFHDFRTELCMLKEVKMMQGMRIPGRGSMRSIGTVSEAEGAHRINLA
jgi:hypothetical protein